MKHITPTIDAVSVDVLERSAVVRRLERIAGPCRVAASSSRALARARQIRAAIGPRLGVVLMTAVMSHVVLASLARPRGAYWLILPALFAVVAVILRVSETASGRPGD